MATLLLWNYYSFEQVTASNRVLALSLLQWIPWTHIAYIFIFEYGLMSTLTDKQWLLNREVDQFPNKAGKNNRGKLYIVMENVTEFFSVTQLQIDLASLNR